MVLGILLVLALSRAGFALGQTGPAGGGQTQLGSVHGTLRTTQGDSGGLAGITVQLAAKPDDGNPLTTQTEDAGHYEFKDVKPGPYTISINQPGFTPFKKSLEVKAGEAATVDVRLELQTVSEQVEVSETTQEIATEDATTPSVSLTQRQLISLPRRRKRFAKFFR